MSDRLCVNIINNEKSTIFQVQAPELDFFTLVKEIVSCVSVDVERSEKSVVDVLKAYGGATQYKILPVSDLTVHIKQGDTVNITIESMQFPPELKMVLDTVPDSEDVFSQLDGITGTQEEVMDILSKLEDFPSQ